MIIKNLEDLAITEERRAVLDIITAGLQAIQPREALATRFTVSGQLLRVQELEFPLGHYSRIFLLGIGKGAAGICGYIEGVLGERLTDGYAIDVVPASLSRVHYTVGTHPLPSPVNLEFTRTVLQKLAGLSERDLVLVVICGGGSAIFEAPAKVDLATLVALNTALLRSGATIAEMNAVRKHLSTVKGGGLAKALYPARVVSLVFSDVPGNDLSVIASGPTEKDPTTLQNVQEIIEKYSLRAAVHLRDDDFVETAHDDRFFERVTNIIMVSNLTALTAMQKKARELGAVPVLYSDRFQGDAKEVGRDLIADTLPGQVLLAGGETTVKVRGRGRGGRNQTLVLAALPFLESGEVIASIGSDGLDFFHFAGALGDRLTLEKAALYGLQPQLYLDDDNSYEFFATVGDGIFTGKLDSNVADLMVVYKK